MPTGSSSGFLGFFCSSSAIGWVGLPLLLYGAREKLAQAGRAEFRQKGSELGQVEAGIDAKANLRRPWVALAGGEGLNATGLKASGPVACPVKRKRRWGHHLHW